MSQDTTEFWVDDLGVELLLKVYKRRGEHTVTRVVVEDDGQLTVWLVSPKITKARVSIPAGHWWDHQPTDDELALDLEKS